MNTILNQSNGRRVSTDRLNREDSQLIASLEFQLSFTPRRKDPPTLVPPNNVYEGKGTRRIIPGNNAVCTKLPSPRPYHQFMLPNIDETATLRFSYIFILETAVSKM